MIEGVEIACSCAMCAGLATVGQDLIPSGGATKTVWSLDQVVTNLSRNGYKWQVSSPVPYDFLETSSDPQFQAFSDIQREFTRAAFELIGDLVPLAFLERSYSAPGSITFSNMSTLGEGVWGQASTGRTGSRINGADVEVSVAQAEKRAWIFGGYNFQALMHEALHTLGVPHPGTYNAGGGATITYAANAQYFQDSEQYTIMSYFAETNTGANYAYGGSGWSAATPMLHDVAVLQALYGANTATRAGDTVYGYGSNAGRYVFDFDQMATPVQTPIWTDTNDDGEADRFDGYETRTPLPILTIWDGGGRDRLDLSRGTLAVELDLREGAFSSTHGLKWNIAIAFNAKIEDATGSAFADTISGNALANQLIGLAGADVIDGLEGNDLIFGGLGIDTLNGGAGADRLWGDEGQDRLDGGAGDDLYVVFNEFDTVVEAAGGGWDTIWTDLDLTLAANVDKVVSATQRGVVLTGNADGNEIVGNNGNDTLDGGAESDRLEGGGGNDILYGGLGSDWLLGEGGNDILFDEFGVDRLEGGTGDDLYMVFNFLDVIVEASGAGWDTVWTDMDWTLEANVDKAVSATQRGVVLTGNVIGNELVGNNGNDTLYGGEGSDVLEGNGGRDLIYGGADGDAIYAGAGDDTIWGGQGDDFLFGGDGADRYMLAGEGIDRILDFEVGLDDLVLSTALYGAAQQAGGAARLVYGAAVTAQATFVYDPLTGLLSYDADGNGAAAAVGVVRLLNTPGGFGPTDLLFGP